MDRPTTASLWKRWLAAVMDVLPLLLLSVPFLLGRREPRGRPAWITDLAAPGLSGVYQVTATRLAGQTLGQRALGIRVVDQETGGLPTIRQLSARWAITAVPDVLSNLVHRSLAAKEDQGMAAVKALEPEIDALRQQRGKDRQELNDALMNLYERRGVQPAQACLPSLLRALPALLGRGVLVAPALRTPLRQGLHDRLVPDSGGPRRAVKRGAHVASGPVVTRPAIRDG